MSYPEVLSARKVASFHDTVVPYPVQQTQNEDAIESESPIEGESAIETEDEDELWEDESDWEDEEDEGGNDNKRENGNETLGRVQSEPELSTRNRPSLETALSNKILSERHSARGVQPRALSPRATRRLMLSQQLPDYFSTHRLVDTSQKRDTGKARSRSLDGTLWFSATAKSGNWDTKSSKNRSLRGFRAIDPEEQNPKFTKRPSSRSSSLNMIRGGLLRESSPERGTGFIHWEAFDKPSRIMVPPSIPLGKKMEFQCDICSKTVKVVRRKEWK